MKSRNHIFDLLCGLCIVRMVSLHVMDFCGMGEVQWWKHVMEWTYYFMSFFFFKAGYFNKGMTGRSTGEYLKDRTMRLFIPYVTSGLIGMAVYFSFLPIMLDKYHKPIEPLYWEHIWQTSSFYGNRPTWFLFSFFVTYLAVYFLEKVRGLHWVVLLFPVTGYLLFLWGNPLWLSLGNVFMGVFFFYLGVLWKHVMNRYSRQAVLWASVAMLMAFAVLNVLWHGEYTMSINEFRGSFPVTVLNMVFSLCGLAGILSSVDLPRVPVICFIGEHSMVYFISHYPMLYFYKFVHLSFGRSIWNRPEEVFILIPAVFCLCTWIVPLVERIPWLSGRWRKPLPSLTPDPSPRIL